MTDGADLGIDELTDFRVIGTGGFSTVYAAWDEGFRRRVAVKLLHSLDESGRRRFDRERGIMGQLSSHPNVITPFRAGYTRFGAPYLVMEYVDGGSLEHLLLRRGRLPWPEAVSYILPVSAALTHAHDQGVLHRDIKPGNILLAAGVPKLTDFGIAAIRESTSTQIAYTLAHCPPETFAQGEDRRDERSDLYSLASTLFTLVTGRPPFSVEGQDSQQAYLYRIIEHEVTDPPESLMPEPVRAFVRRGLAKEPDDRLPTARDFSAGLHHLLATASATPGPPPAPAVTGSMPAPWGAGSRPATTGAGERHPSDGADAAVAPAEQAPGNGAPPLAAGHPRAGTSDPGATAAWSGAGPISGEQPHPGGSSVPPAVTGVRDLVGQPAAKDRSRLLPLLALPLLTVALIAGGWWWLRPDGLPEQPEPPEVVWNYETGSSLSSKPAVDGTTLVIGARNTNTVHAVDTRSGTVKWLFRADDGVAAGPTIADDVVYIGSLDGTLHALDLEDGGVVWQEEVGDGIDAAALVLDDLVVVGTGTGDAIGVEREDGELRWTTPLGGKINSRPAIARLDGDPVVAIATTDGVLALLDPETGDEVESFRLDGGVWFSNPLVLDQTDGDGQEIWIGTSKQDGGTLWRIDLDSGDLAQFDTSAGVGTDPLAVGDDLIVAGNDLGELFAVDRVTLGEVWREGYANANQIKGSPALFEDQIIFGTHDRQLIAITTDGVELWRFDGEQIFGLSAPVVDDNRLYVGNDAGTVFRFDLESNDS